MVLATGVVVLARNYVVNLTVVVFVESAPGSQPRCVLPEGLAGHLVWVVRVPTFVSIGSQTDDAAYLAGSMVAPPYLVLGPAPVVVEGVLDGTLVRAPVAPVLG
jgi:hypothetical protein